jgi:hypothetical protein
MRLKFLFFPVMLVISLAIFIMYIWPEYDNLKKANEEKTVAAQSLKDIGEKQSAIELVGTQITNNSGEKTIVDNYLPNKKVEEQIIAGINYLALDSQVSLVDISIKDIDPTKTAMGGSPDIVSSINSSVAVSKSAELPTDDTLVSSSADAMQFSRASIKISGEYEKIRLFLDQMQRMPLLNSVRILAISTQAKNLASGGDVSTINPAELLADIVVDFGYLKPSSFDNNKIIKFKPGLDNETISTLEQYISQKTVSALPAIGDNSGKGKANPFLP